MGLSFMKLHPFRVAAGLFVSLAFNAAGTAHYVDIASVTPMPPYTNWTTAAVTIQAAVDAAGPGDEIVVTNGIYATGGRVVGTNLLVNRVAVGKPLAIRSVNGPQSTIIQGYQVPGITNGDGAIRCVYLTDGQRGLAGLGQPVPDDRLHAAALVRVFRLPARGGLYHLVPERSDGAGLPHPDRERPGRRTGHRFV